MSRQSIQLLSKIIILSAGIRFSTAIVGGSLAYIKDNPFFVILTHLEDNSIYCGGSIIGSNVILTAAHCIINKDFHVYVGVTEIEELARAKPYEVSAKIPHPDFQNGRSWFDLALVQLENNIKFGPNVSCIFLAERLPEKGKRVSVIGYGKVRCVKEPYGRLNCIKSTHLKEAKFEIMDFGHKGVIQVIGKHQSICHGDSGSPMIYDGRVIGVTATVQNVTCHGKSQFAPVFNNLDWIKRQMKRLKRLF